MEHTEESAPYIYPLTLPSSEGGYSSCVTVLFSHATDIGNSMFNAGFLLSLLGICGGVSRVLIGCFADMDFVKNKHIYQSATLANGVVYCFFSFVKHYVGLAAMSGLCCVLYGTTFVLASVHLAEELGLVNMPITSGVMYWFIFL